MHICKYVYLTLFALYYLYHLNFDALKVTILWLLCHWEFLSTVGALTNHWHFASLVRHSGYMCITWAMKLYPLMRYSTT